MKLFFIGFLFVLFPCLINGWGWSPPKVIPVEIPDPPAPPPPPPVVIPPPPPVIPEVDPFAEVTKSLEEVKKNVDREMQKVKNHLTEKVAEAFDPLKSAAQKSMAGLTDQIGENLGGALNEATKSMEEGISKAVEEATSPIIENVVNLIKTQIWPSIKNTSIKIIEFGKKNIDQKLQKLVTYFVKKEAEKFCPGADDIFKFGVETLKYYCLKPSTLLNNVFKENDGGWGKNGECSMDSVAEDTNSTIVDSDPLDELPLEEWFAEIDKISSSSSRSSESIEK